MSKTFRPYEPDQIFLMPASIRERLPGNHLAYFVSDVADQLDLSAIMERHAREERGYPPYHLISVKTTSKLWPDYSCRYSGCTKRRDW